MIEKYLHEVINVLQRIYAEEEAAIRRGALLIKDTIEMGGVINVIGAGHSAMIGEELFYRAGGLAPVNPILDVDITLAHGAARASSLEGLQGYARTLLSQAEIGGGDLLVIVSNSGVKVFPVEAALWAREHGITTIGISSRAYSDSLPIFNPYGKRLWEVVDIFIDNKVPPGDAALRLPGMEEPVGPLSTIAACFIANAMVITAVELLVEEGRRPPIWLSSHLPGAEEHNYKLMRIYRGRIKLL